MLSEQEFIHAIRENKEIIFKVCNIYMDTRAHREDLFQEILLNAWKGLKNFREESKFSTWLYSVALNTAITFFKKEQRRTRLFIPDYMVDKPADPDMEDDKIMAMNKAIGELSRIDKALVMLYLDDFSHQQIAEMMGITVNNVSVKLNRIKNKLKENSIKYYK